MSDHVQPTPPETFKTRKLDPDNCRIYMGEYGMLWCEVGGEGVYRGVFAVRAFPVNHPNKHVSIRYYDIEDQDKPREIGIIENLKQFSDETRALIKDSLEKHYYEQAVTRVYGVKFEFGLLVFDVETDSGRTQFMMRWQQDRAQDYGETGKALLDVYENRYIIADIGELPPPDQGKFIRYIYW